MIDWERVATNDVRAVSDGPKVTDTALTTPPRSWSRLASREIDCARVA